MRVDALVIGAGHNGLVSAAYLARAGLRTCVVERRRVIGGACVTEELWPGFQVSRAAYVVGLLRPVVARQLALARHGLRLIRREPSSFTPLPEGGGLLLGSNVALCCREIRRLSARDAERYPDYERLLDRTARLVVPLLDRPPPDPARPRAADLRTGFALARGLLAARRQLGDVVALLLGSAARTLTDWFESDPLRGTLATDALIGAWASPSTPGTGYVLVHHVMGRAGGARGSWAYVAGGMGKLAEALAQAARQAGCVFQTDAAVRTVRVEGGRVQGVELEDGRRLNAPVVLSSADPKRTLLGLVGAGKLPDEVVRGLNGLDFRSPVAKINLALDRLPQFRGVRRHGVGPEHATTIHLGSTSLEALERSFEAARAGRLPEQPMIELTIPSVVDSTLAPPGRHVASVFVQHVPPAWSSADWAAARDRFTDRVIHQIDDVAPGFASSVLHRELLAPPDLERLFGLTGGNIFHGAMTHDRLLFLRPLPRWSRYRTPIEGLYLCGAGTHPGGGVMGACGRNAARQVLKDLRARKRKDRLRSRRLSVDPVG